MRNSEDIDDRVGELVRYGTIAEVDLAEGKVRVEAGDVESAWIRWASPRAGATRTWSPPSVGEQVIILSPDGELEGAVALPGIASTAHPPAGDSLRELIKFEDGAELAYDPETHALEALLPEGATVKIVAEGGITLDATEGGLTVKGDVSIEGELHATGDIGSDGDVVAGTISLQQHKHGGVSSGGSLTGLPQ